MTDKEGKEGDNQKERERGGENTKHKDIIDGLCFIFHLCQLHLIWAPDVFLHLQLVVKLYTLHPAVGSILLCMWVKCAFQHTDSVCLHVPTCVCVCVSLQGSTHVGL